MRLLLGKFAWDAQARVWRYAVHILDLGDPAKPRRVGGHRTEGQAERVGWLPIVAHDVAVSRTRAYLAQSHFTVPAELHGVDLSQVLL